MDSNKSSINFLLSDAQQLHPREEEQELAHSAMDSSATTTTTDLVKIIPRTLPPAAKGRQKKRYIRRPRSPRLSLSILQQPKHAKVSTRPTGRSFPPFSEHRPIHPPPVLQLHVDDFHPTPREPLTDEALHKLKASLGDKWAERLQELEVLKTMRQHRVPAWVHYSTFFVTARLRPAHDGYADDASSEDLLIGTNVASGMALSLKMNLPANGAAGLSLDPSMPFEKVHAHNYGVVFVFPDISVRKVGQFKLKFDLFEVFNGTVHWRTACYSNNIQVFTPKKFPGSTPSSPLTSFLYRRGARIRQRKRPTKRLKDGDEDNDDDDDNDNDNDGADEDESERSTSPRKSRNKIQKLNTSTSTYTSPLQRHRQQPSQSHIHTHHLPSVTTFDQPFQPPPFYQPNNPYPMYLPPHMQQMYPPMPPPPPPPPPPAPPQLSQYPSPMQASYSLPSMSHHQLPPVTAMGQPYYYAQPIHPGQYQMYDHTSQHLTSLPPPQGPPPFDQHRYDHS